MLSNPDRVVVDIPNAWLSPKTKKEKKVSSRFVRTVRIAQFNPTTVRLVVEPKAGKNNYSIQTRQRSCAGARRTRFWRPRAGYDRDDDQAAVQTETDAKDAYEDDTI